MQEKKQKVKKNQKEKDEMGQGFEEALKGSFDISSEEYAQPLVEYLKNR